MYVLAFKVKEIIDYVLCGTGAVFTKGLIQVLGLAFVQKYNQIKPETWLRPFVNTAPDVY